MIAWVITHRSNLVVPISSTLVLRQSLRQHQWDSNTLYRDSKPFWDGVPLVKGYTLKTVYSTVERLLVLLRYPKDHLYTRPAHAKDHVSIRELSRQKNLRKNFETQKLSSKFLVKSNYFSSNLFIQIHCNNRNQFLITVNYELHSYYFGKLHFLIIRWGDFIVLCCHRKKYYS